MSRLNITQPLSIWSIMATIRWCPIFPKWDSYQPLFFWVPDGPSPPPLLLVSYTAGRHGSVLLQAFPAFPSRILHIRYMRYRVSTALHVVHGQHGPGKPKTAAGEHLHIFSGVLKIPQMGDPKINPEFCCCQWENQWFWGIFLDKPIWRSYVPMDRHPR